MFESEAALRASILQHTASKFFESFVKNLPTTHFDQEKLALVSEAIQNEVDVAVLPEELVVVGSSKLGFALHAKRAGGEEVKPAFRPFDSDSDIDLAICSPKLFEVFWKEASAFACQQKYLPYRSKKFGDYMTYGWFRADQLPIGKAEYFQASYRLKVARGKVRNNRQRGHPKVDFGVFFSVEHLSMYQCRSIDLCRKRLENPL